MDDSPADVDRRGGGTAHAAGAVIHDKRGKFTTGADLTAQQMAFVLAYVSNGGEQSNAAKAAGYSNPRVDGWRLLRNTAIVEAIRERQAVAVISLGQIAIGTLKAVMQDEAAPAAARVAAAKWSLEAAGHGLAAAALKIKAGENGQKPISEMSIAELEAFLAEKEAALQDARPNSAPSNGTQDAEVLDS